MAAVIDEQLHDGLDGRQPDGDAIALFLVGGGVAGLPGGGEQRRGRRCLAGRRLHAAERVFEIAHGVATDLARFDDDGAAQRAQQRLGARRSMRLGGVGRQVREHVHALDGVVALVAIEQRIERLPERFHQRRDQLQAVGQARQASVGKLGACQPPGDTQILGLAQELRGHRGDLAPVRLLGADQFLRRGIDRAGRARGEAIEFGDAGIFQIGACRLVVVYGTREGVDIDHVEDSPGLGTATASRAGQG